MLEGAAAIRIESILHWTFKIFQTWIYVNYPFYLNFNFWFSGKPTTKLRNLVDWRSSLIQNSTILKHRSLGKTPQRIKWTWTNCLIFCQKRSLTPQHQVQDQSGQCCQFCLFQNRQLNAENCQNKLPVLRMSTSFEKSP